MDLNVLKTLFTPKQIQVWDEEVNNQDFKIMINYGAVRSGKTFVDNVIFLYDLYRVAKIAKKHNVLMPQYILAGTSSKTIQSNILDSVYNMFGLKFHHDTFGNMYARFPNLPTVKIVQAYDKSISGIAGIRGNTAYGAYINEAILANPSVFQEILDRCSGYGAHVICDTNPGSPNSFLLPYIKSDSNTIITNHFKFSDNKENLDPKYYKQMLETTPSGAFFERTINGNFVANSGMIYKDFDKKQNQITPDKIPPLDQLDLFGGIDWGYNHFNSIVVLGEDKNGVIYLIEERTRRLKTIDYWVEVARQLIDKYGNIPFTCDTNEPADIERFRQAGINAQYAYKNQGSVIHGIELVSKLIKARKFKRVTNESDNSDHIAMNDPKTENFMDEIYAYIWDQHSQKDKPFKHHDHVLDALRYPIYKRYIQARERANQPSANDQFNALEDSGLLD